MAKKSSRLPRMSIEPSRACADPRLSRKAFRVLKALCARSNRITGRCDPSIARIADDTCMHKRTVQKALAELKQHGYIEPEYRSNESGQSRSTQFNIVWEDAQRGHPQDAQRGHPPGCPKGAPEHLIDELRTINSEHSLRNASSDDDADADADRFDNLLNNPHGGIAQIEREAKAGGGLSAGGAKTLDRVLEATAGANTQAYGHAERVAAQYGRVDHNQLAKRLQPYLGDQVWPTLFELDDRGALESFIEEAQALNGPALMQHLKATIGGHAA